jgi:hypothetical protein
VIDADGPAQAERARFPALDPEPPPRPWYQRVVRFVAAAAAFAAMILAAIVAVHAVGQKGAPKAAPPSGPAGRLGRIVLLGSNDELALSEVDGTHMTFLVSLGHYPNQGLAMSADGRYLVTSGGTIIGVHQGRLSIQPSQAKVGAQLATTAPDPLADHDRDLVLVQQAGTGAVAVVPVATGKPVELGVADVAEGDPQQAGVFVSVPTGRLLPQTGTSYYQVSVPPDGRVELRDVGHPSVVLATASWLNRALGQGPARQVALAPYPSPDGNRVAITVMDASGSFNNEAIVILDRNGRPEYTLPAGLGPAAGQGLAWSPDGRSLAFVAIGAASSAVVVWTPGRPPITRVDPTPGDMPLRCLWAPDGSAVLCATWLADRSLDWNVADAGGGPVLAITAIGQPVAWLANPSP